MYVLWRGMPQPNYEVYIDENRKYSRILAEGGSGRANKPEEQKCPPSRSTIRQTVRALVELLRME